MAELPARPSLDHLRHEARDLLRAAQAGDPSAVGRIQAVSAVPTLAGAQLAVAREYGFASWARLKTAVQARTTDLARQAEMFCEASIRDWTGRAAQMLAATPELAGYSFATAVILGDAERVRAEIARDPGLATRIDARTGWTPLHAVCASQWNRLDPARAGGLAAVARLLLDAGADPRRYADDDGARASAAYEAVESGCSAELLDLLLSHGAEPDRPGHGGRSPYALARIQGRDDLADPLRRYGAAGDISGTDLFLAACQRADRDAVQEQLHGDPGLPGRLSEAQQAAALIRAAETGHVEALRLMLDLGFPVDARGGDHGGTALHAAAYCGSAGAVRLLLDHGADLEARDATWNSPPLDWAAVGSGERPATNPRPDWIATVQALLDADASTESITISPDEPKQPSPEVAALVQQARRP